MANKTPGIGNFSAFFVFPYRGFFVCSCLKVCMPILFSHTVGFLFAMVDFFCTFCSPNVMGFLLQLFYKRVFIRRSKRRIHSKVRGRTLEREGVMLHLTSQITWSTADAYFTSDYAACISSSAMA
jgi:hypothetical protein